MDDLTHLRAFQEIYFNNAQFLGISVQILLGDRFIVAYPTPANFDCDKPDRTFELAVSIKDDPSIPLNRVLIDPWQLSIAIATRKLEPYANNVAVAFLTANAPTLRSLGLISD